MGNLTTHVRSFQSALAIIAVISFSVVRATSIRFFYGNNCAGDRVQVNNVGLGQCVSWVAWNGGPHCSFWRSISVVDNRYSYLEGYTTRCGGSSCCERRIVWADSNCINGPNNELSGVKWYHSEYKKRYGELVTDAPEASGVVQYYKQLQHLNTTDAEYSFDIPQLGVELYRPIGRDDLVENYRAHYTRLAQAHTSYEEVVASALASGFKKRHMAQVVFVPKPAVSSLDSVGEKAKRDVCPNT